MCACQPPDRRNVTPLALISGLAHEEHQAQREQAEHRAYRVQLFPVHEQASCFFASCSRRSSSNRLLVGHMTSSVNGTTAPRMAPADQPDPCRRREATRPTPSKCPQPPATPASPSHDVARPPLGNRDLSGATHPRGMFDQIIRAAPLNSAVANAARSATNIFFFPPVRWFGRQSRRSRSVARRYPRNSASGRRPLIPRWPGRGRCRAARMASWSASRRPWSPGSCPARRADPSRG